MKKILVLIAVLFTGLITFGQQPSLPNGNFESWTEYHPGNVPPYPPAYKPAYFEPNGGFFRTLNILDTVPTSCGVTVYRAKDTVHSGSYAARCMTQEMIIVPPVVTIIPGVIGTIKINWIKSSAILGVPYDWTSKAERFQGWYQSYPVGGDSTAAIILLSKWNTGTHKRDTIAYNRIVFKGTVNAWTQFDQAISYRNNTVMPDTICVLLLSCAGFSASNMLGSVGQVGSQALFDDVTITNVAGIEYVFNPGVEVKVNPNPASSCINVKLDKVIANSSFEIYDSQGRMSGKFEITEMTSKLNVSNLSPGVYYYRFRNSVEVLNTGSFIIAR